MHPKRKRESLCQCDWTESIETLEGPLLHYLKLLWILYEGHEREIASVGPAVDSYPVQVDVAWTNTDFSDISYRAQKVNPKQMCSGNGPNGFHIFSSSSIIKAQYLEEKGGGG